MSGAVHGTAGHDAEFEPAGDPRAVRRADTNHLAKIIHGGEPANARVIDVSQTGACVETTMILLEGDEIRYASVRMGERPAMVIWSEHGRVGLAFTDEVARLAEARGQPAARHWLSALRKN